MSQWCVQKHPWPREHPSPPCSSAASVWGARLSPPVGLSVSRAALQSSVSISSPWRASCCCYCWSLLLSCEGAPGAGSGHSLRSEGPSPAVPQQKARPSRSPWDPRSSPGDLWCLYILSGTQEGAGLVLRTPAGGPHLSFPHPSPARTGSLHTHTQVWAREGVEDGRREAGPRWPEAPGGPRDAFSRGRSRGSSATAVGGLSGLGAAGSHP